ncbi:MAG: chemotaxis protein CheD [Rhodobacteraceae bacterium]|nr:chemotaxis protein CheD [Paracoccaceae bacterium]
MIPLPHVARPASLLITQGEYAVCDRPETMITTILGSCVAVCLRDPVLRMGGMNHILLPNAGGGRIGAASFGASDMERLVNALIKRGAIRQRLEAKVFGGAAVVTGLSDIGARNAAFVRSFLAAEGIVTLSENLGGDRPRQVRFWPESGRAQHRFVGLTEVNEPRVPQPARGNGVELF